MNQPHHPAFINLVNTSDGYSDLSEGLAFHCQNPADHTVLETRDDVVVPLQHRDGLLDAVKQLRAKFGHPIIHVRVGHPVLILQAANKRDIVDAWRWMRSNRINLEAQALVPFFRPWDKLGGRFQAKAYGMAVEELGWQHRLPAEHTKTIGSDHPAVRRLLDQAARDIADLFGSLDGKDANFRRFASIARTYGLCGELERVASRHNASLELRPGEFDRLGGAYRVVSRPSSEVRSQLG